MGRISKAIKLKLQELRIDDIFKDGILKYKGIISNDDSQNENSEDNIEKNIKENNDLDISKDFEDNNESKDSKTVIEEKKQQAEDDYETNTDGSILTQDIDRTKLVDVQSNNDVIYAIEIASDIAYADKSIDELEFSVDDTYINKNQLTRNTKVGTTSDIMELHPIEKIFWDYDNIINDFNIKAGVK